MKVLIVDDINLITRSLTSILEKEGYEVCSVENGLKAFDSIYKWKPDIILLDIILPDVDGFEVCKIIKEDEILRDIPIIMISSKTDGTDLKKALELGAFDYIKKPIDEIEVLARLESALRFQKYQDRLKEMATKDSLTGVYNHALLIELLEKELGKKNRSSGDLSFCMIDIDHFKKINDTFGDLAGDLVLKKLAEVLTYSLRGSDIVGRYGGEEFGIILPDIDVESSVRLCDRIRKNLEGFTFNIKRKRIKVTISIGICHKSPQTRFNGSEMIKAADDALYIAKQNGRNRVEVYK